MRRLLIVLCAGALVAPAAASAKSENGVFTIEVSGTTSGGWAGPGVPCVGDDPSSLKGYVNETSSVRTPKPVPIIVQGLRSTLNPYTIYRLPDWDEGSIPVEATVTREGQLTRMVCGGSSPPPVNACGEYNSQSDPRCYHEESLPTDGCFGTRTFKGSAVVGFTNVSFGAGNATPSLDHEVFDCHLETNMWEPSSLLPGPMDALGGYAPMKRAQFTKARPGRPIVFRIHDTAPCKNEAPATCTEAVGDWTVTFRFVCRARRDSQTCLTKKVRRRLGI
jgi:hypothetical protein